MNKNISSKESILLGANFKEWGKERKRWIQQRQKKENVYQALSEYIGLLENSMEQMEDSEQRYLAEKEIRKLKSERKKYYVPSILEMAKFELAKKDEDHKNKSAQFCFSHVKKLEIRKKILKKHRHSLVYAFFKSPLG